MLQYHLTLADKISQTEFKHGLFFFRLSVLYQKYNQRTKSDVTMFCNGALQRMKSTSSITLALALACRLSVLTHFHNINLTPPCVTQWGGYGLWLIWVRM